jgi:glycerophosphoryl diester phosphodiesterase
MLKNPTVRLLALIILVLGIGLGSAWIYLRLRGITESVSPVRSEFFKKYEPEPFALIAFRGESSALIPNSMKAFSEAAKLSPKIILWADILMTADDQIIVSEEKTILSREGVPTLVAFQKYSDLAKLWNGGTVLKLKDLLLKFPDHRFILNVRDYRPGLDGKLATLLDDTKASDRVLIQSDVDGILRDMRMLRPDLLFGTSQAQITQLLMLAPFALESIAPLKGDVYISEATRGESKLVNERVVNEVHRRGRKIFVGPAEDEKTVSELRNLHIDGLITAKPEAYLGFL